MLHDVVGHLRGEERRGAREEVRDVLRRVEDGGLRLASREIVITQTVLLAKNLNVFL